MSVLAIVVSLNNSSAFSELQLTVGEHTESQWLSEEFQLLGKNLLLAGVNQAAYFSHAQQVSIDYLFVVVIAIFLIAAVHYRFYQPIVLAPPWYLTRKAYSGFRRLGWKIGNLLYRDKALLCNF